MFETNIIEKTKYLFNGIMFYIIIFVWDASN